MTRSLYFAVCVAVVPILLANTAKAEKMWGTDKALHFGVGATLGGIGYGGLWLLGDDVSEVWLVEHNSRPVRFVIASSMGTVAGLVKEIYDADRSKEGFSAADLLWNAVGALVGSSAFFAVELAVARCRFGMRPTGKGVVLAGTF
jgi:uncharacterized protein YfiM (DUF2279 family)